MTKRARQAFANTSKKVKFSEDLVSGLPDKVLINIISRLTIREAARTSLLSRRWKYLWTLITNLDFEASRSALSTRKTLAQRKEERSKDINWVNRIELHKGLRVDEFRINFDLVDSDGSSIPDWIYTVISNGVEKFELNLPEVWYRNQSCKLYTFLQECFKNLKNPRCLSGIKSLRSLCFHSVDVRGEILEFFTHNGPLERLRLACLSKFNRLKVVGLSIRLKYLDLYKCNFQEVEISARSLLSFNYFECGIDLKIMNVPHLADLSIGGTITCSRDYAWHITDQLVILSYFSQLKNLDVGVRLDEVYKQLSQCDLPQLRHLTHDVLPCNLGALLFLCCVIKKCHLLQKLTLKLNYGYHLHEGDAREIHEIPKCLLTHLKVLELLPSGGSESELEIASYVLENATTLEKVIVKHRIRRRKKTGREFTNLLKPKLPQGVQLTVLETWN